MTHFFLTSKLLSESTFLAFISKVNEDFIALDTAEYEFLLGNSQSFELSTSAWIRKCNDSKTLRMENGVMQPFKEYALNRLKSLIMDDLNEFIRKYQTGKVADTTGLLKELEVIQGHVSSAVYLAPVAGEILKTLKDIPVDISTLEKLKKAASASDNEQIFTWNAGVARLGTLFHDLRTSKPANSNRVYLDGYHKDLAKFIAKHFRDEEGNEFPLDSLCLHTSTLTM